jgi:RND family efflux transporter MFP subunit
MRRSRRTALAAACLATALSACGSRGAPQNQGPPPVAVDVAQARRSDIATYVSLDGQIAPLQQSTLSSPQSGNLVAVYVNEGQHVRRGQLLAKIDDAALRATLAQQVALAQQGSAALSSSRLQYPVTAAQGSSTIVTAQQQLASARNAVATADAAYRSANSTYVADKSLLGQGYVAQTAYDQAVAAYVQALQALNTARETERQAVVALRAAQQQGVNAAPIQLQQIAQNRGALAAARAQVTLLQTEIAQTSIVAPFDAVVTQRLLDPGSFASPNQPVLQVSQVDTVYVNVNVPDEDLGYVRTGTPVTFTTTSVGARTYRGTVFDVNATPTAGTLSYRARLRVDNPNDFLRGGMLVAVNVRTAYHRGAIVVPRAAVFSSESGANVFAAVEMPASPGMSKGAVPVGKGGKPGAPQGAAMILKQAKQVPVVLGLQTDTLAEVRSPQIVPGTTVITTRPDTLSDKSPVAIGGPAAGSGGGAQ